MSNINNESQTAQYLFDKTENLKKNKKKEMKLKKLYILIILLITFISLYTYFASDSSKIKYINITGNSILTKQQILDLIDYHENDYKILINTNKIKNKLLDNDVIVDCKVNLDLNSVLNINLIEANPLTYTQNQNEVVVYLDNDLALSVDSYSYQWLIDIPYLIGFTDNQIKRINNSLMNCQINVIHKLSKIYLYPLSYDPENCVCVFDDENNCLVNIDYLEKINNYFSILINMKVNNSCIFFDKDLDNAYAKECPWNENINE